VTSRFPFTKAVQIAVCGALLLTGCPGTGDMGGRGSVAGLVAEGIEHDTRECQIPANAEALAARLLELVNQERTQRGLHALTLSPQLTAIAEDHACEMIEGGFFAHVNPYTGDGPAERAIKAGYVFLALGENLAGGQPTPEQTVAEWMNSTQGHREIILAAQWGETGIAVRTGGEHGVYWVQEFGNPP